MKRRLKRTISFALACMLLLALLPAGALAASWENHWSASYVQTAVDNGWIDADQADPGKTVTRAEEAEILGKALGQTVTADGNGADAMTRQDAIVLLADAFGLKAANKTAASSFSDWAQVSETAQDAVSALVEQGVVNGVGGNKLAPTQTITLGELLKIVISVAKSAATDTAGDGTLKAGAGAAEIVFDQAMFPVEGFSGEVHINPYARVLVMEQGTRSAIVSLEMVNIPSDTITAIKNIVHEKTGTPVENIWVHATHAITTPHAPSDEAQLALFKTALTTAVTEAAAQAADTFQSATMGIGTGTCDVNANHGIQLSDGWYIGTGSTMPSNKEMTIIRFDSLNGEPIGFFISYGIKPTAIDNVEMSTNTRKISSDVPGVACRLMEEEFGVPAMFCMPAAADQIPREVTTWYEENEQGEAVKVELTVEEGIEIADRLGAEMGNDAIAIAKDIVCTDDTGAISMADTSFTWASKSEDGEVEVAVRGLTIGDSLAFVGFKPEVNAATEQELWEASPYAHTLLVSFVDGDQKYMPDDEAYDLETWEFKRTGLAKGAAEQFVTTAAELLEGIQTGEIKGNTQSGSQTETGTAQEKKVVQMGGYNWIVIKEEDGKQLLLSEKILEDRAYHSAGGAVTWETSELRSYLNGEFYDKTFTDAEKARIVETTIENKSNSQYGVAGGNDTTDKVFLLSLSEAENYLGSGIELLRGIEASTGASNWWHLRSPGEATDVAASVNSIGLIDYHGVAGGVTDPTGGVRPAMWITAQADQ